MTGMVSPVKAASSTKHSPSSRTQSAGILKFSFTYIMVPQTKEFVGTYLSGPSGSYMANSYVKVPVFAILAKFTQFSRSR